MNKFYKFKKPYLFKFPKYFTNQDGKKIRYGHSGSKKQNDKDIKGTVVITTGYGDFTESYFETINDFQDRGYSVWIMDWQGQGGSERYYNNTYIPSKSAPFNNIRDLHKFRSEIIKPHKNKPVILVSHSMGGQMALHYLKNHPNSFDSAILATPFVDTKFQGINKYKMRTLSEIACMAGFGHERVDKNNNIIRRIKEVRAKLRQEESIRMELHQYFAKRNPALKIGDPTFYWARNMMRQTNKIYSEKALKNIKTPILFGICENDKLVNNQAIERAAKHIPNASVAHIKDGYHALWTEREKIRTIWWQNIDKFLKQHENLYNKNNVRKKPNKFGF